MASERLSNDDGDLTIGESINDESKLAEDSGSVYCDIDTVNDDHRTHHDKQKDDGHKVEELAQMSSDEVMEKIEQLKNIAYTLGRTEAHEMTRGRLLDVFGLNRKRNKS